MVNGVFEQTSEKKIAAQLVILGEKVLEIHLPLNIAKYEVSFLGELGYQQHCDVLAHVKNVIIDNKVIYSSELTLLDCQNETSEILLQRREIMSAARRCQPFLSLDAHTTVFLLTRFVSVH